MYTAELFGLFWDLWRLPKQMKFKLTSKGWTGIEKQNMMERYSRQKELNMQRLQGWKKHDTFQEQ